MVLNTWVNNILDFRHLQIAMLTKLLFFIQIIFFKTYYIFIRDWCPYVIMFQGYMNENPRNPGLSIQFDIQLCSILSDLLYQEL